eukprot:scaffold908_cov333-Prasinococcus_capsulatus_cf.AAC.8
MGHGAAASIRGSRLADVLRAHSDGISQAGGWNNDRQACDRSAQCRQYKDATDCPSASPRRRAPALSSSCASSKWNKVSRS